jgi:hypothetical protein
MSSTSHAASRPKSGCGNRRGFAGAHRQADRLTEAREGGVGLHKVLQGYAQPAKCHGKARLSARNLGSRAGAAQGGHQFGRSKRVGQADDRDVERLLKRLADRDRAAELAVEVLRRIGAEGHGTVVDQGFRVGKALVEGKAIDKRFQCRSPESASAMCHVDKAGAAVVAPVGACRPRQGSRRCGDRPRQSR